MIKHLLFISMFFYLATACRKSEKPASPLPSTPRIIDTNIIKLAPSTIWIDSITGTMLDSCNPEMLRFKGNSLQLSELQQGNMLVSAILPKAPIGFLGKVLSVTHQGDIYTIQLGPATLTEAFEKLKIDEHIIAQPDNTADAKLTLGFNTPQLTIANAIKLKGSIELSPALDVHIDIEHSELRDATLGGSVELEAGFNLEVYNKIDFLKEESPPIFHRQLPPFSVGPLVIWPEVNIVVGIEGSSKLLFELKYKLEALAAARVIYNGNDWSTRTSHQVQGIALNIPEFNHEVELKVYVKPIIQFDIYKLAFAFEPKAYLDGKVRIGSDANCELSAGVAGSLSTALDLFSKSYFKKEYDDLFDINYLIYTCNCGNIGHVTDIDGNLYDIAKIAGKDWMMQNLRVTHYSNGDTIPQIIPDNEWANENITSGAWAANGGDAYGHLYNWYTVVDKRGVCPVGWHVPDSLEWDNMVTYYGDHMTAGTKLKAKEGWGNGNGTNVSCFTGLPGGWRETFVGQYLYQGGYGSWWTTSPDISSFGFDRKFERGWNFVLYGDAANVGIGNFSAREGVSVRCVKNE